MNAAKLLKIAAAGALWTVVAVLSGYQLGRDDANADRDLLDQSRRAANKPAEPEPNPWRYDPPEAPEPVA